MTIPDKLCPMAFGNSRHVRTECICLGGVCSWFVEETGKCAVAVLAKVEAKKTVKAKKPTEG